MSGRSYRIASLVALAAVFLFDRGHKFFQLQVAGWTGGEYVPVTGFFDYVLVWNTGVSYGLLGDVPSWTILVIMTVAIVVLGVWWFRARTALTAFGLAIALGGAFSHVLDRMIYGAVPDFFHFHWGEWSFYVFNIADAAISLGVILLFVDAFRPYKADPLEEV